MSSKKSANVARAVLDLCEVAKSKCKTNLMEKNKEMNLDLNAQQMQKISFIIESSITQVFNNSVDSVIRHVEK